MQSPFPLWSVRLAPGDALVLCTDGVTETFDAGGVAFGLEGLRRVVADTPADALDTLPASIGRGPRAVLPKGVDRATTWPCSRCSIGHPTSRSVAKPLRRGARERPADG